MSRRKRAANRDILPDPKYNNVLVARFINKFMKRGKKRLAERIFYQALEKVEEQSKKDGLEVFKKALSNIQPQLEVKSRRVGGATYQVPIEVREKRKISLAIQWLIQYASERHQKSMVENLAMEFLAAANNEGGAIKKKEDTHKMAEANKAFAHFRW